MLFANIDYREQLAFTPSKRCTPATLNPVFHRPIGPVGISIATLRVLDLGPTVIMPIDYIATAYWENPGVGLEFGVNKQTRFHRIQAEYSLQMLSEKTMARSDLANIFEWIAGYTQSGFKYLGNGQIGKVIEGTCTSKFANSDAFKLTWPQLNAGVLRELPAHRS